MAPSTWLTSKPGLQFGWQFTSVQPSSPEFARRHLRGPGRKALAAVALSGAALVIFGGLTLRTLLVIAAAGAIVAAARRYQRRK
jgi:hypothetical protein